LTTLSLNRLGNIIATQTKVGMDHQRNDNDREGRSTWDNLL